VITLREEPLSPEAFAPFGRTVMRPSEEEHASGAGWRWWGETALLDGDDRPWGVGYLDLEPTAPRFDWAERHMKTLEAIFATSSDLLVYVGPPDRLDEPQHMPSLERFRVFRVPAGSGVVLDRGVWHGAPFAAGERTSAIVLILEGTGRDDLTLVRFPETPVDVETPD
jgi:ureidoglycolate lyase